MKVEKAEAVQERLDAQLKELRLPTVKASYEELARQAEAETLSYERYLLNLCDQECQERQRRKIERLLRQSCLPLEKTFATFDLKRLPTKVARQVQSLRAGDFVDRQENLLAFGKPGSGKTHLLCALAHDLVHQVSRVLKRLARYEVLLIDDLGYVQQDRAEMEVLFTLLADRYERGSVLLTSNLPFSKWEAIFKDPMTTAAAIDRLVHHAVIVELNLPSYRLEHAKKAKEKTEPA
jgi:DNA replication protein DnaC